MLPCDRGTNSSCPGIKRCGSTTRRAGLAKTVGICKGPRREQPANRQQRRTETSDKGEEEKAEERLTQLVPKRKKPLASINFIAPDCQWLKGGRVRDPAGLTLLKLSFNAATLYCRVHGEKTRGWQCLGSYCQRHTSALKGRGRLCCRTVQCEASPLSNSLPACSSYKEGLGKSSDDTTPRKNNGRQY